MTHLHLDIVISDVGLGVGGVVVSGVVIEGSGSGVVVEEESGRGYGWVVMERSWVVVEGSRRWWGDRGNRGFFWLIEML